MTIIDIVKALLYRSQIQPYKFPTHYFKHFLLYALLFIEIR
jgi:hypothetical protein